MNHTEQPKDTPNTTATAHVGISLDDMSMLNQVLQQVKGISCVSCPETFDVAEQTTTE